jgi:Lrp/AsnC family leucine-responsive transcriptional regulator
MDWSLVRIRRQWTAGFAGARLESSHEESQFRRFRRLCHVPGCHRPSNPRRARPRWSTFDAELGRRVSLSPPATADRVQALERAGVITGYRAEVDPKKLGYPLSAIVRVKPYAGQLPRIVDVAADIPEVVECLRITGEDCFYMKVYLRSIEDLSPILDRLLVYGQTTTSIVNGTPIPWRPLPVDAER